MLYSIVLLEVMNAHPIDPMQKQRDLNLNYDKREVEALGKEIDFIEYSASPKENATVGEKLTGFAGSPRENAVHPLPNFLSYQDTNRNVGSASKMNSDDASDYIEDGLFAKASTSVETDMTRVDFTQLMYPIKHKSTMGTAVTVWLDHYTKSRIRNDLKSATTLIFFVAGFLALFI